jgi:hypothetical protein
MKIQTLYYFLKALLHLILTHLSNLFFCYLPLLGP